MRPIPVFFYGLFMDAEVLRAQGVHPSPLQPARVPGYRLRIGQRATLVPDPQATAHGFLTTLTHLELDQLYQAPGLQVYRAEPLLVYLDDGLAAPALCFNLPEPPPAGEHNPEYAAKLRGLGASLGLPPAYLASIV